MRAIRFIIMAAGLPKGRFPGGTLLPRRGRESVTIRYLRLLILTTTLAAGGAPRSTCQLLPKAKAWLAKKMPQWRRILQGETGYNEPDVFAVCRLVSGFPYTDRQQKRLFIRNFFTLQDRLDLTHEYLHLAFDGYPTGLDENYIETLTRQLLMD
ncbi:protein [Escherichia coli]|uniref:Protein n=1 Tax=Escherichia coli TaxID=562 RepID=A0A377K3P9_ECOLX|nr:protein [Escherichia coli]